MLKTDDNGTTWFITQPDHARLAACIAAHWGNTVFGAVGSFGQDALDYDLRAEALFSIAEHDNGWTEWEANPSITVASGFPMGLAEVLTDQEAGIDRWRIGLTRFPDRNLANLIISHHAYWLYAVRVLPQCDPAFIHPLFWKGIPEHLYPGKLDTPRAFMAKLQSLQS